LALRNVSQTSIGPNTNDDVLWIDKNVLFIPTKIARVRGLDRTRTQQRVKEAVKSANNIVVDLRADSPSMGEELGSSLDSYRMLLTSKSLTSRARYYLLHSGYRPRDATSYYFSSLVTDLEETFTPDSNRVRRTIFLVNGNSVLPAFALAL